jgi:TPR repeat protein
MLENGWGTKQDIPKALERYRSASDAGQLEAKVNWARCVELGIGGKPDPEKADFLWQQAAEAGFPSAQSRLGIMELNGIRRPRNETAAREWFEKAALQADPDALYRMSHCYQNGWGGAPKDTVKAVEYTLKAANGGNLDAINQVGMFYQHGFGLRQDKVAAAGWFNFAAEYEHPAAMTNLGECYETGQGVKPNPETAAKLFAGAAKQNDPIGCLHLGRCFIEGRGVAKNPVFAYVNLTRAFELGIKGAQKQRDETKALLNAKQLKEAEALLKQIQDASAKAGGGK